MPQIRIDNPVVQPGVLYPTKDIVARRIHFEEVANVDACTPIPVSIYTTYPISFLNLTADAVVTGNQYGTGYSIEVDIGSTTIVSQVIDDLYPSKLIRSPSKHKSTSDSIEVYIPLEAPLWQTNAPSSNKEPVFADKKRTIMSTSGSAIKFTGRIEMFVVLEGCIYTQHELCCTSRHPGLWSLQGRMITGEIIHDRLANLS